ncbi:MAG TPA: TMEM175 family protein [Candidatus Limnocylindrales bacterium]|nr:TMEM175 family protein [Candidatus Limnocylindrales bacterium]
MTLARRRIEGTARIEAFSDGVLAIIVTLLIFEVRLPEVARGASSEEFWNALVSIAPKFGSFALSFAAVAIYWVNHHHFFDGITHTDWKLLWLNNLLLFFLAIVPFTTAVLGDHLDQPIAIALYALDLGLAAAAFTLMVRYVLFVGRLIDPAVSEATRRTEFRRSLIGTVIYLACMPIAFVLPVLALVFFVAIPVTYVVPTLFSGDAPG